MAAVFYAKRVALAAVCRVRDLFSSGGVDMVVSASPSRFIVKRKEPQTGISGSHVTTILFSHKDCF